METIPVIKRIFCGTCRMELLKSTLARHKNSKECIPKLIFSFNGCIGCRDGTVCLLCGKNNAIIIDD